MSGHRAPAALAAYFDLPCLMVLKDGNVETITERVVLDAFNIIRTESFLAGGAVRAALDEIEISEPGGHVAFASVRWYLYRSNNSVERHWRHAYSLRREGTGWRILVSAFQSGA